MIVDFLIFTPWDIFSMAWALNLAMCCSWYFRRKLWRAIAWRRFFSILLFIKGSARLRTPKAMKGRSFWGVSVDFSAVLLVLSFDCVATLTEEALLKKLRLGGRIEVPLKQRKVKKSSVLGRGVLGRNSGAGGTGSGTFFSISFTGVITGLLTFELWANFLWACTLVLNKREKTGYNKIFERGYKNIET